MLARHRGPRSLPLSSSGHFTQWQRVCVCVHAYYTPGLVSPAIDTILRWFFFYLSRLDLNAKIKKKKKWKKKIPGLFRVPSRASSSVQNGPVSGACRTAPGIHYCLYAGFPPTGASPLDYFNIRSCRCLFINACLRRVSWFSALHLLFVSASQSQLFDLTSWFIIPVYIFVY